MKKVSRIFEELKPAELYEILRVRAAVFVVEQQCAYQDLDGLDSISTHVFYEEESGQIEAYLRYKFVAKTHRLVYGMKATYIFT